REVASKLLQIKAIMLSPQKPFTWSSGMLSPIYCDNRITLSYPEVRSLIVDGFVKLSQQFQGVETIAGVATAGIPHGALLADRLGLPFVYVRSKAKGHGRQNLIEGYLPKGKRVVVVEDLISTGGSSLQAIQGLRDAGAEIVGALAIFSYGFDKAVEAFAAADCPFYTLSNYEVLVEEAQKEGYVTQSDLDLLKKWRSAPESWSPAK
ncbi:MAG: orotate phosphoribosyltransferase, partial [Bacteroidota bacterium]